MSNEKTCKLGDNGMWCPAMNRALGDTLANHYGRGLTAIVLTNLATGTSRVAGIAYRKSGKDNGLMLNYCPWCGEPIEEGAIGSKAERLEKAASRAVDSLNKIPVNDESRDDAHVEDARLTLMDALAQEVANG